MLFLLIYRFLMRFIVHQWKFAGAAADKLRKAIRETTVLAIISLLLKMMNKESNQK